MKKDNAKEEAAEKKADKKTAPVASKKKGPAVKRGVIKKKSK